jgi:hypothetical protein
MRQPFNLSTAIDRARHPLQLPALILLAKHNLGFSHHYQAGKTVVEIKLPMEFDVAAVKKKLGNAVREPEEHTLAIMPDSFQVLTLQGNAADRFLREADLAIRKQGGRAEVFTSARR